MDPPSARLSASGLRPGSLFTRLIGSDTMEKANLIRGDVIVPDAAIDAIWASEAEARLAAYHSGNAETVRLSDILRK